MNETTIKNEVATAIGNTTIADKILDNFNKLVIQNQIKFPENYNVGNQLKLAYLNIMQKPDLKMCTTTSIGQALTEMALQGLEIDHNQCYFIKFGSELKLFRSYFGDMAVALRTGLVKDIKAVVIHKDDEFEMDVVNDEEVVTIHKTKFENKDKEIIGAYAVATLPDGNKRYCIMTKAEINKNWSKSKMKENSVQADFPQEMAKRTVIRRLVKTLFNSANTKDNYVSSVISSYNRTTEDEYDNSIVENSQETTVSNSLDEVLEEENTKDLQ